MLVSRAARSRRDEEWLWRGLCGSSCGLLLLEFGELRAQILREDLGCALSYSVKVQRDSFVPAPSTPFHHSSKGFERSGATLPRLTPSPPPRAYAIFAFQRFGTSIFRNSNSVEQRLSSVCGLIPTLRSDLFICSQLYFFIKRSAVASFGKSDLSDFELSRSHSRVQRSKFRSSERVRGPSSATETRAYPWRVVSFAYRRSLKGSCAEGALICHVSVHVVLIQSAL